MELSFHSCEKLILWIGHKDVVHNLARIKVFEIQPYVPTLKGLHQGRRRCNGRVWVTWVTMRSPSLWWSPFWMSKLTVQSLWEHKSWYCELDKQGWFCIQQRWGPPCNWVFKFVANMMLESILNPLRGPLCLSHSRWVTWGGVLESHLNCGQS